MELLQALQEWYARQCDGEWEEHFAITIETCDNPGWWVKIDLADTELQDRPFLPIAEKVDEAGVPQDDRWLRCFIKDRVWHGVGDETRLPVILRTFLDWASGEVA